MRFSWKRVIHIVIREYMIDVISDQLMKVHSIFWLRGKNPIIRDPHDLVIDSQKAQFPTIEKRKQYLPEYLHIFLQDEKEKPVSMVTEFIERTVKKEDE